ncbi:gamma-glutamyltransferase [Saccharopolyspora pogona]|uniref:gamma-glutamyltransferase n=1 Tax=Saccharopolyspora pogona TaxID=333966 RepID=UPI001689624C|nr:gamma-glutamyltransferase [Saccharopolyspora pogona]
MSIPVDSSPVRDVTSSCSGGGARSGLRPRPRTSQLFPVEPRSPLEAATTDSLSVDYERATPRTGPRAYLHTAGVATADDNGTIVSSLVSVFDDFGSAIYVPEAEIRLNNRAAGFTAGPNAPRAATRPVHTLAPAVVRTPSSRYALATPGADGQVQTLLQVLAAARAGKSLDEAIAQPRWRSQDGDLVIPPGHPARDALAQRGHRLSEADAGAELFGAVVCAGLDDRRLFAVADWRRRTLAATSS